MFQLWGYSPFFKGRKAKVVFLIKRVSGVKALPHRYAGRLLTASMVPLPSGRFSFVRTGYDFPDLDIRWVRIKLYEKSANALDAFVGIGKGNCCS